jgi:hypothetical protein
MLPDEIAELNKMMEEDWQEPKEEDDEVQGVCAY